MPIFNVAATSHAGFRCPEQEQPTRMFPGHTRRHPSPLPGYCRRWRHNPPGTDAAPHRWFWAEARILLTNAHALCRSPVQRNGICLPRERGGLRWVQPLISAILLATQPNAVALATVAHEDVEQGLVYLRARATTTANPPQNKESTTNGFLVSEGGLVLTVYELLSGLGTVTPESISIDAITTINPNNPLSAIVLDSSPTLNLILLKISGRGHTSLIAGSAETLTDDTDVYSSSVSSSLKVSVQSGKLKSRDGPRPSLWTLKLLDFDDEQRGSPVYNEKTEVVGIARGQIPSSPSGESYMIPIELATEMLAPARIDEIVRSLKQTRGDYLSLQQDSQAVASRLDAIAGEIDILREQTSWKATLHTLDDGTRGIKVRYDKILGKLFPNNILVKVKAHYRDLEQNLIHQTIVNKKTFGLDPGQIDERSGTFTIVGIEDTLKDAEEGKFGARDVTFEVEIVPFFSDGDERPPVQPPLELSFTAEEGRADE